MFLAYNLLQQNSHFLISVCQTSCSYMFQYSCITFRENSKLDFYRTKIHRQNSVNTIWFLRKGGWKKANSTWYSQAVTHLSTNHAQRCLTAVIRREPVYSTWYGRWQVTWLRFRHKLYASTLRCIPKLQAFLNFILFLHCVSLHFYELNSHTVSYLKGTPRYLSRTTSIQ